MGVFDFLKSLFGQQPEPADVYLLIFSTNWCGPSKRFIKEIKEGGINNFTLVDTEANEDLAAKYNVRNVPTTILMKKNGEIIKKWVGYDDEDTGQKKFVKFIKAGNYSILPYALKSAQNKATPKLSPNIEEKQRKVKNTSTGEVSMPKVVKLVNEILKLEHSSDTILLKSKLKALDSYLSGSKGKELILNYKDKENLCLCFSFLIHYVGGSDSQKTSWAEKAFYCIVEHLDHQENGRQGQSEACILFFIMLCVGRNYLKPRLQKIIETEVVMNAKTLEPLFDAIDNIKGAQNVIDQFSLMATSGIRDLGPVAIQPMMAITSKYNGTEFFAQTIKRTDLMRYNPMNVIEKMRFLRNEIAKNI